jgi:hypothetical protein
MKFMKYNLLIFILLLAIPMIAQENGEILFTLEYHYGINANAFASDNIAEPFLDEGLGRNFGLDINFIFPTKKGHLLQFSTSANIINLVISPSNLIYEIGYDYNDDCCIRLPGFYAFTGGMKYVYPFYSSEKLEFLGAAGANINLDISTTSGSMIYEGRRLWYHADGKTGPAIFASFDLSSRLIYYITEDFLFTTSLTFVNSPFYTLDSAYVINSRDGIFRGNFHQRISSAVLGIGLGMKL